MPKDYPPLTVGVVTYPARADAFGKLLRFLAVSVERYPAPVSLRIGNNGGAGIGADTIRSIVSSSTIATMVDWQVLDSPENNIAVGRNLVIGATSTRFLAFIDDDEYPRPQWLEALVRGWQTLDCTLIAGPILPVYESGTPTWVRSLDLHNSEGKKTGDLLHTVSSGNFLVDLKAVDDMRFDPRYGKSGGSDTELFMRLRDAGCTIRWAADAIVDEDVPLQRASSRYMIKRYTTQGAIYRRILIERNMGRLTSLRFSLRSFWLLLWSSVMALPLVILRHPRAGYWVKSACFNLGIVLRSPGRPLYR